MLAFNIHHKNRTGKIFSNSEGQQIILFDYQQGLNKIFIKIKEDYQEVKSSGKSAKGYTQHINLELSGVPYYDMYQDLYLDSKLGIAVLKSSMNIYFFNICQDIPFDSLQEICYIPLPDYEEIYLILENSNFSYAFIRNIYHNLSNTKIVALDKKSKILSEIKINNSEHYRDGGTKYFYTEHGTIYIPTPFNKDLKPTIDDIEAKKVKVTYQHYDMFRAKFQHQSLEECFEEALEEMKIYCASKLEKAILHKFGPGNWYSNDYKKQIMSKVNILEFKEFLKTII
jgi:hypothetical protein